MGFSFKILGHSFLREREREREREQYNNNNNNNNWPLLNELGTIQIYKTFFIFLFLIVTIGEEDLNLECLYWKHKKVSIELKEP